MQIMFDAENKKQTKKQRREIGNRRIDLSPCWNMVAICYIWWYHTGEKYISKVFPCICDGFESSGGILPSKDRQVRAAHEGGFSPSNYHERGSSREQVYTQMLEVLLMKLDLYYQKFHKWLSDFSKPSEYTLLGPICQHAVSHERGVWYHENHSRKGVLGKNSAAHTCHVVGRLPPLPPHTLTNLARASSTLDSLITRDGGIHLLIWHTYTLFL